MAHTHAHLLNSTCRVWFIQNHFGHLNAQVHNIDIGYGGGLYMVSEVFSTLTRNEDEPPHPNHTHMYFIGFQQMRFLSSRRQVKSVLDCDMSDAHWACFSVHNHRKCKLMWSSREGKWHANSLTNHALAYLVSFRRHQNPIICIYLCERCAKSSSGYVCSMNRFCRTTLSDIAM